MVAGIELEGKNRMKIKLLALDMDGTTLKSDHVTVSPANRAAIEAANARGVFVVTATGRMRHRLPEAIEQTPGLHYAVTCNGASVFDLRREAPLYANPIPMDTALRVFDTLAPFPVFIEIYSGGFDYVERGRIPYIEASGFSESRMKNLLRGRRTVEDQREYLLHPAAPVEKFNVPYLPPEHQQAVWEAMRGVEGVALTSSVAQNIEINAAGTDKGDGLRFLCEYLGVAPDEVMAVGDSRNDLEMLTFAGLAAAPANATDDIKAVADWVGPSNDDDCVARAIERFLL